MTGKSFLFRTAQDLERYPLQANVRPTYCGPGSGLEFGMNALTVDLDARHCKFEHNEQSVYWRSGQPRFNQSGSIEDCEVFSIDD